LATLYRILLRISIRLESIPGLLLKRKLYLRNIGEVAHKVIFVNRFFGILIAGLPALAGAALAFSCLSLPGCSFPGNSDAIPVYTYSVVNIYPHDPDAFTQGLVLEDGVLYEGTGLFGQSTLRRVELETGAVVQIRELSDQFFGEGITIYGDKIIQLTWQSNVGFVYDKTSFELLQEFNYSTEGWGITHDGTRLIMSDGTSTLHFLDPQTFEEISQLTVFDSDGPVTRLNELEYIKGEVYANVWQTDRIARIAPGTGGVVGWIDLEGLLGAQDYTEPVDVLNGIAYDADNDRLFVTGKLWPKLFEIELIGPD
jgi:glutamine cyclotransferase